MNFEGAKIVAIDDTPSILTFLRVSLEDEGAIFHGAPTATRGLELCKEVVPDIVILDLGLPDVDGLDILPEIKDTQEGKKPVVLILTVRKERETIIKAIDRGADGYLSKPFMVEDLLDVIESQLELI